jgi:cholestenol delta-isomerase
MSGGSIIPPLHPYYPIEAKIVGYLANEWNTLELCSMFAAGCAAIFSVTYVAVKRVRPNASASDLTTIL